MATANFLYMHWLNSVSITVTVQAEQNRKYFIGKHNRVTIYQQFDGDWKGYVYVWMDLLLYF